jgi:phosphorylcholine metabolism protein LicD
MKYDYNIYYIFELTFIGTLLGWYWGQRIQPWDTDIDIQMLLSDMIELQNNFGYIISSIGDDDGYMIEFNPFYQKTKISVNNVIDMRFIDKRTGIFIDITNVFPVNSTSMYQKLSMLLIFTGLNL